jgi:hypothetical protein
MLKRPITYEDFNGETLTETFYFNLSKAELVELETDYEAGLVKTLMTIVEAQDERRIIKEFKRIIMLSFGVKSDDGKRFIKSDALRADFESHAAYQTLFMELSTDAEKAAAFVNGIMPPDLVEAAKQDQDKPTELPSRDRGASGLSE